MLADEESIYQITNDTKLQEFLKKIQQVRSEEAAKKYRVALASMEKISPLPDGSYYAVYRDALKAKAEKPEKDLNAILAALEKPDASPLTDAEAVYRLREAFAVEPELAALEKYKNRYIKIIQNMNATVDCTASIKEPPGKVYMSTGYEWPLEVAVRCNNAALQSHLALRFDSAGPVSFGDSATKSVVLILDKLKGEFPVTELSVNKEENKFSLRGISRFNETMAVLSVYAPKPTLAFRITPEEYTLKGVPVFYSESYDRQAAGAQPATPWKTLTGKETQATLAMNGQFTLGGQRDGAAYDMVYGHPNGKYSDSIWSSYITLSVDGKFYRFDKIPGLTRSESADKKTLTTTGKLVEEDA
ncbi:MAG TPA: hypothetical protein PLY93_09930, partial [Turneriella sp.]|nr:hypothetical protein [Turneriella sp.]